MRSATALSDSLLLALLLAALVHTAVILGVRFEPPARSTADNSLEITLIQARPPVKTPPKADYVAPEDQEGSGQEQVPAETNAPPATEPKPASTPPPRSHRARIAPAAPRTKPVITRDKAERANPAPAAAEPDGVDAPPARITADVLRQQIAEVGSELNRSAPDVTKRPRVAYVNSVNAHKYKAAAYEKAWQEKIERIGNLNYPEEARRQNLSGGLLLSVGINRDGTVHSIQVRRSSGYAVLDDAAERIVRLAAPFAPLPPELSEELDVLVITRTWRFFNDSRLQTAP